MVTRRFRRQRRIVGKQWLAVGLARDRENMRQRQPFPLENLAHRVGTIRRKIERSVIAPHRHEARRGVADDGNAQWRRLEGRVLVSE